jgi:hypothetical protein
VGEQAQQVAGERVGEQVQQAGERMRLPTYFYFIYILFNINTLNQPTRL